MKTDWKTIRCLYAQLMDYIIIWFLLHIYCVSCFRSVLIFIVTKWRQLYLYKLFQEFGLGLEAHFWDCCVGKPFPSYPLGWGRFGRLLLVGCSHLRNAPTHRNVWFTGHSIYLRSCTIKDVDVDIDWRGFGGRDLIPTHRESSWGCMSTEAYCANHRKETEHSHYPHTSVRVRKWEWDRKRRMV
jgi:hypothetical protein